MDTNNIDGVTKSYWCVIANTTKGVKQFKFKTQKQAEKFCISAFMLEVEVEFYAPDGSLIMGRNVPELIII